MTAASRSGFRIRREVGYYIATVRYSDAPSRVSYHRFLTSTPPLPTGDHVATADHADQWRQPFDHVTRQPRQKTPLSRAILPIPGIVGAGPGTQHPGAASVQDHGFHAVQTPSPNHKDMTHGYDTCDMTHGLERKSRAHAGNDGRGLGLLQRLTPRRASPA